MNKRGLCCLMLGLLLFICWVLWANTAVEINEYRVSDPEIPESLSGFRIAQISDLHNGEFGQGNEKLLTMLVSSAPDIIVITGDLIDSRNTDIDIALEFVRRAVEIAPVYYVTGNHEARVAEYSRLKSGLESAGVTVLENGKTQITAEGASIILMGVDDPSFLTGSLALDAAAATRGTLETMMEASDGYTVLLAHRPELFEVYVEAGVDLVFSGHAHGGQFRLPFIGGLVAPNQGFFPKYDAGLFTEGDTTMVVSRGIGNSIIPLRFNNRPEIILVELIRGEEDR